MQMLAVVGVIVLLGAAVLGYVVLGGGSSSDDAETIADAPEGCPSKTNVVVKSDEAGTQNITTTNSNFLMWGADDARIVFTNYALDAADVYSNIIGENVLTVIKLDNEDGTALATGSYRKTAEDGSTVRPNQYTSEYNISTEGLAGGVFDNDASVTIDYIGDDYVCGSINADDGSSSIVGDFIAKVTKQF